MKKIGLITFLLAGVLLLSACQAGPGPATQNLSIAIGEGTMIHELENGEEELTGEFHRWEPAVLVVHKGDKVVLTVTNPRGHAHSLILPEFGVATPRLEKRGGTATVEFTADKVGVFQFACGLPYDEEAGNCGLDHKYQVGHLIVLER